MVEKDFEDAIQERGCASIMEVQREIRWERSQEIEQTGEHTLTICQRFLERVTDSAGIQWEDMFVNRGQLGRSIMSLMSTTPDPGFQEEHWTATRRWLRTLPECGIYNWTDLMPNQTAILPIDWRKVIGVEGERILRHVINEANGGKLEWEEKVATQHSSKRGIQVRQPDVGEALVGGLVRKFYKNSWVIGKIMEVTGTGDKCEYQVRFNDGKILKWSIQQVQRQWYSNWRQQRSEWTRADQAGLCSKIHRVFGINTQTIKRKVISPYQHRTQDTEWEDTETWYTCTLKESFTTELQVLLLKKSSTQNDRTVASHMVERRMIFWVPRETWPNWPVTTQACSKGWWVRAEAMEERRTRCR
jgi:hypothetical protein